MSYIGRDPDSLVSIVQDLVITTPTKIGIVVTAGLPTWLEAIALGFA
jgi:hypothetical protein